MPRPKDSGNDSDEETFRMRAVLPIASSGPVEYDPNAWGECSGSEFLRRVIIEAKNYPTIIQCERDDCEEMEYSQDCVHELNNKLTSSDVKEPFFNCPQEFLLPETEQEQIIEEYRKLSSKIAEDSSPNTKLKFSESEWKKICAQNRTLPKNKFNELTQEEIIKLLKLHCKWLIELSLVDEPPTSQTIFWIYVALVLLDTNQTSDTYSILRDISRTLSEARKDIVEKILYEKFTEDDVALVGEMSRIILIISKLFGQTDLSD